jgi:hypothetical protein
VTFDDGSYAKVVVNPTTTSREVCQQVMKRRGRENLTEQNAVLCVSSGSGSKSAKLVPLDPNLAILQLYENARMSGQIVEFSIRPKEMFTKDDWDPQTRRERYNSISTLGSSGGSRTRKGSVDFMVSPDMVDEYTKKWSGEAEVSLQIHFYFQFWSSSLSSLSQYSPRQRISKFPTVLASPLTIFAHHGSALPNCICG